MNENTTSQIASNPKLTILEEKDEIISRWLGLIEGKQHYRQKGIFLKFNSVFPKTAGLELIRELYALIEKRWDDGKLFRRSEKNWSWRPHDEGFNGKNPSIEKQIEKRIANLFRDEWCHQIPVASGLFGSAEMKKACIDLARHLGGARYEFYELKFASDNPVFAAMEILFYGLFYIHARVHRNEMDHTGLERLFRATSIELRVLAPTNYYKRYLSEKAIPLLWLQEVLTDDLWEFAQEKVRTPEWKVQHLQMSFQFSAFDLPNNWPKDSKQIALKIHAASDAEMGQFVKQIVDSVKPLYPSL